MRYVPLLLLFCVLAPSSLIADEPEKLAEELIKALEQVETRLKKIDSKESAQKALADVKEDAKKLDTLREKSEKIKVEPKREEELLNKYGDKLYHLGMRIGTELTRLEALQGAAEVVTEVKKLVEKMGLTTEPKKK